jgi:hypothetical protein
MSPHRRRSFHRVYIFAPPRRASLFRIAEVVFRNAAPLF